MPKTPPAETRDLATASDTTTDQNITEAVQKNCQRNQRKAQLRSVQDENKARSNV